MRARRAVLGALDVYLFLMFAVALFVPCARPEWVIDKRLQIRRALLGDTS